LSSNLVNSDGLRLPLPGLSLFLATLLTACAAPSVRQPGETTVPLPSATRSEPAQSGEEARRQGSDASTATTALLSASRTARDDGDYESAAAVVERALAIDPNNAALWIELAELRNEAGDRAEADALARKALTLAGNDRTIAARAARLGVR
jgi:Flp pilus assembly protein TadD